MIESPAKTIGRVVVSASAGLLASVVVLVWVLMPQRQRAVAASDPPSRTVAGQRTPPTRLDPAKVMGVETCAECHTPAVAVWKASRHATQLEQLAQAPHSAKYAAAMGISVAKITQEGLCVHCHGLVAAGAGRKFVTGVACESCHGASGGDPGWLNRHASYGANDLDHDQETREHRRERFAAVDKLGMLRPGRPYELAKNCLGCHLVPEEDLVNKAGHHAGSGDFELVSWIEGDVCHNLFLDPTTNHQAPTIWKADTGHTAAQQKRLLYVLGQLAQLEVSVRNIAHSKAEGTYSQAMKGVAGKARSALSDVVGAVPALADLKPILDGYTKIALKLKPAHKDTLLAFADQIALAAHKLVASGRVYDAKELDEVIPKKGNGTRYVPPRQTIGR